MHMFRMCIRLFVLVPTCPHPCDLSCIIWTMAACLMVIQWPYVVPEKSVSTSLEFILFASSWRDDCCWWLIKVSFAVLVLVLFSNLGLGELGSRSLLPVIGWTYHFGALFWLSSSFIAVSQLPGLRLVVFFVSQKAVTRPGIHEGSLVFCV